jgi:SHS2 domain-containing protein
MTYRYMENMATADVALLATGNTLEEVFLAAWDGTLRVMIENAENLQPSFSKKVRIIDDTLEMLLFQFLQELLFRKDADNLFLRPHTIEISPFREGFQLSAVLSGEPLDPERHRRGTDVKAITLHRFSLFQEADKKWKAQVILDV